MAAIIIHHVESCIIQEIFIQPKKAGKEQLVHVGTVEHPTAQSASFHLTIGLSVLYANIQSHAPYRRTVLASRGAFSVCIARYM